MVGTAAKGSPEQRLAILRIISMAFMVTPLVYVAVLYFLQDDIARRSVNPTMSALLTIAAVFLAGGSIWAHRRSASAIASGLMTNLDVGSASFDPLLTAFVAASAMAEAVAVCGLVYGFLGGGLPGYLPFLFAAEVLLYTCRPANWPFDDLVMRMKEKTS